MKRDISVTKAVDLIMANVTEVEKAEEDKTEEGTEE